MSILNEAVKRIMQMVEIREPPEELSQGLIFDPEIQKRILPLEPNPELIEAEGEELLGVYYPIASPGQIILYWDRIGSLFWHTALQISQRGYYLTQADLSNMAYLVSLKTNQHERFHHFCDVCRHLFGGHYDRLKEEALAVAWSYRYISNSSKAWNSKIGSLFPQPYREVIGMIFRYRAPGYRDWVNFRSEVEFADGLTDYLIPPQAQILEHNGVDIMRLLIGMEGSLCGGLFEQLHPKLYPSL
jgi:hypothetical protein